MINTNYTKMRKSRLKSELFNMERILFNLGEDVVEQELLFKSKAKQDIKGDQPPQTTERGKVPENLNRKAVETLFNGKAIKDIPTKELEFILDRLDGMSKTNRYALVALDRVYAAYLTRITGAGNGGGAQPQKNKKTGKVSKNSLQDLNTQINALQRNLNSTKDTKKKNRLKTRLNLLKQERDKLKKQSGGE